MDLLDIIRRNKANRKFDLSSSSEDDDDDYSSFFEDVPMAREFLTKKKQKNKPKEEAPSKTKQLTKMEVKRKSVIQRAFESAADKFPAGSSTPRPGNIISTLAPKLSPILVDVDENINNELNNLNERPKSKLNKSHKVELNITKERNDNLQNISGNKKSKVVEDEIVKDKSDKSNKELIDCVKPDNVNEVEKNEPDVQENIHIDDQVQELGYNELPKSRKSTIVEPDKTNCKARVLLEVDASNKLQENETDINKSQLSKSRKTKLGKENATKSVTGNRSHLQTSKKGESILEPDKTNSEARVLLRVGVSNKLQANEADINKSQLSKSRETKLGQENATKSVIGNRSQLQKSKKGESFLKTDNRQKSKLDESRKAKSKLDEVEESDDNIDDVELDEPDAPEKMEFTEMQEANIIENSKNVEINQMENTREERLELGAPSSKRCIKKLQDITVMKGVSSNTSPGLGKLHNTRSSKVSDKVEGNSARNVAKILLNKRKTVSTNTSLPINRSRLRIKDKRGSRRSRVKTQDFGTSPMVRDEDTSINDNVFEEIMNDNNEPAIRLKRLNTRDFGTSPLMTNEVVEETANKSLSKHKRITTQDFGTSPIVRDENASISDNVFEEKMDTRASSHKCGTLPFTTDDVISDENVSKMKDKSVSKHKYVSTHDFGTSPMVSNEDTKVNDEKIKNKPVSRYNRIKTQDFGTSPMIRDDIIENKSHKMEDKSVSNRKHSTTHDFGTSTVTGCDADNNNSKDSIKLKVNKNKSISNHKLVKTKEFGTSPIVRNDDIKNKSKSGHKHVNTHDFGTSPMVRDEAVNSNNDVFKEDLIKDKPVSKLKDVNTQEIGTPQMVTDAAISENVNQFSVDENPGNIDDKTPVHKFKSPMKETTTKKRKKKTNTLAQLEVNSNSNKNTSSKNKRNNSKNTVDSISSSNTTRNQSSVHKRLSEKYDGKKLGNAALLNYLDSGTSLAAGTTSRYNRVRRPTRVIQIIYEEPDEPKSKRNNKQPQKEQTSVNMDESSPINKRIGKKRGRKPKQKNNTENVTSQLQTVNNDIVTSHEDPLQTERADNINIDQMVHDEQIPTVDENLRVNSGESTVRGKKRGRKPKKKNNTDNVTSQPQSVNIGIVTNHEDPLQMEDTGTKDKADKTRKNIPANENAATIEPILENIDQLDNDVNDNVTSQLQTVNSDIVTSHEVPLQPDNIEPILENIDQMVHDEQIPEGDENLDVNSGETSSKGKKRGRKPKKKNITVENDGEEPKEKMLKNNSEETKNDPVVTSNINDNNEMELSENQNINNVQEQQDVNGNDDPDFVSNGRHKDLVYTNKLEFHIGNEFHSITWASDNKDLQWYQMFPSVMITNTMESSSQTIGLMEIDAGASIPWCRTNVHEVSYFVCKSTAEVILPGRFFIAKLFKRFIIPKGMPFTIINQSQTEKLLIEFTKYEETRMG